MGKRRLGLLKIKTLIEDLKRTITWKVPFSGQTTTVGTIDGDTTLTVGQSGTYFRVTTADAVTVTLPEATANNVGWYCTIYNEVEKSGNTTINTGRAADLFIGNALLYTNNITTAALKTSYVPNVSSHNKISMNQTTSGGREHDILKLTIVGVNRVLIDGDLACNGSGLADPFTTQ